jgi:hypothetical protein
MYNVVMTIAPGGALVPVSVAPTSLSFSATQGGAAPSQSFSLTAASGSAPVTLTANTNSGGNWLSVTPSSGNAPLQATVSINGQGLAVGNYSGAIQVLPQGGNAQFVNVSLTVTASQSVTPPPTGTAPAIASVTPATLTANQQNQVVTVKGSGFSSQTAVSVVFGNYEFPSKVTPVTVIDSNTLSVTVRGMFLFQPDSLGLRLTNPGAAGSAGFAIAVQ